jgi:PAS domain S-box-containing protein
MISANGSGGSIKDRYQWFFSIRGGLLGLVVIVCAVGAGLDGLHIWNARRAALAHAGENAANIARAMAQQAADAVRFTDAIMIGFRERLETERLDAAALDRLEPALRTAVATMSQVRDLAILNAQGVVVATGAPGLAARGSDLSNRDYFVWHRQHDDRGLHFGAPLRAAATANRWSLPLSRRIDTADGGFAGLMLALVNLDDFQQFYGSFDIGSEGSLMLASIDGTLLTRRPLDEAAIGRDLGDAGRFRDLLRQSAAGAMEFRSPVDGVLRLDSYRRVADYPLAVMAALSQREGLAEWRANALRHGATAAVLVSLLAGFGWRLSDQIGRRIQAERNSALAAAREAAIASSYRALVDTATDIITVMDLSLRRRFLSPACRDMLGYEPEALVDGVVGDIMHPDDLDQVLSGLRRLIVDGVASTAICRLRHREGYWVWVEIQRCLIRSPETGDPIEILSLIRDITRRREAEQGLQAAKAEAERANQAKSDFLTAMSHELRTPMNSVLGFAQLLDSPDFGPLTDDQRQFVAAILDAGRHLMRLIEDILELSKIESGGMTVVIEPVAVVPVIKSVLSALKGMADKAGILVRPGDFGLGLPPVLADRTRLAQALLNFGTNAVKYNRPGGSVSFAFETVEPSWVRIAVIDTGMGIPCDRRDQLFQPFSRLGVDRSDIEGTGIGLVLTRKLVGLMGGRLDFDSRAGEGSRFWIDLPVATGAPAEGPTPAPSSPQLAAGRSATAVILHVEDNAANRALMRHLLSTGTGLHVIDAADGATAVALAGQVRPDLVILDLHLPDQDGIAVLRRIRSLPGLARVPVIIVSAHARTLAAVADDDVFGPLAKPIDVTAFRALVEEALASRPVAAGEGVVAVGA